MPVTLDRERSLWEAGAGVVVGVDEVGRGALAGPVAVGAVAVAPCRTWPDGLADSKALSPTRREAVADALAGFGVARAVGEASSAEVDERGVVGALRLAGLRALASIAEDGVVVDAVLLDGTHDWLSGRASTLFDAADAPAPVAVPPVTTVVRGDGECASIAAASVLAKVARDAVMRRAHEDHPDYGWASNKGYGALEHLDAIRRLGPTPLHRRTWRLPDGL